MQVNREEIERFVRGELGCGCPDEVFQHIILGAGEAGPGKVSFSRLVVGERLLIYVFGAPRSPGAGPAVKALATHGLADRDEAGFNRFRLVALLEPGQSADEASAAFREAVARDGRAHLHCLEAGRVPPSLIPPGTGIRPEATG